MPKGIQQNRNTSGLRPLNTIPEDEARSIQAKGRKANAQKYRAQKEVQEIARAVLAMGVRKGRVTDVDSGISFEEAAEANVSVATKIFVQELKKYFETGDIEARNFIFSKAYPDNICSPGIAKGADGGEPDSDDVRIHLIRGEKPVESDNADDEATPPADGGAES